MHCFCNVGQALQGHLCASSSGHRVYSGSRHDTTAAVRQVLLSSAFSSQEILGGTLSRGVFAPQGCVLPPRQVILSCKHSFTVRALFKRGRVGNARN
jgi:hypothetical protein